MTDPMIHVHKTVLMQRLLDGVVRGYHWHTTGTLSIEKAGRFAAKLGAHYGTQLRTHQRSYRKAKGFANTRLLFLKHRDSNELTWWLIATDGNGRVHAEETLRDARVRSSRISIADDYELLPVTRSRRQGGGTRWTWRMPRTRYSEWFVALRGACRTKSTRNAQVLLGSLHRSPGFSGIRTQVNALHAAMRREWRRRHGTLEDFPVIPRLPYVERLADTSVPLSRLHEPGR